ncbi:MAG: hypothetical protein ACK4TI_02440 [Nitrososphaerales archaeon]
MKAIMDGKSDYLRDIIFGLWTKYYGLRGMYPKLTDAKWPTALATMKNRLNAKVHLVSKRDESERHNIEDWLKKNQLYEWFDEVILVGEGGSKGDEKIDILIDDSLDNCIDVVKSGGDAILWAKDILDARTPLHIPYVYISESASEVVVKVLLIARSKK